MGNLKSSSKSSLNTKTDEPNINSTMSKDEINYMIIQLQRQGYQIKQKQKDDSYATAVLKSNGGSSSYPKKIFFLRTAPLIYHKTVNVKINLRLLYKKIMIIKISIY